MTPEMARPPDSPERDDPALEHRIHLQEEFEFAPDGQLLTDGHGVIIRANYAAVSLLKCPKEFLIRKPLGLFLAEGHRARFYECLSRLWQGTAVDQFETRIARRGEEPRDITIRVSPTDSRNPVIFRWSLHDVTQLKRTEVARSELLKQLITTQEDERRRISRELHDSVSQLLTVLALSLRAARAAAELPPPVESRLVEAQQAVEELGRVAQELAQRLRPTALDNVGLHAVLTQFTADWSARTGINVDLEASAVEAMRLPLDVETAAYRIVQEALTNVARHAHATRVSVVVGRYDGQATLAVEDDGVGFDSESPAATGRLGLVGMSERAALVDGTLDVESSPGNGTTILARFPIRTAGPQATTSP